MKRILVLLTLLLAVLFLPAAASAAPAVPDDAVLPGGGQPLGPWNGIAPTPAAAPPDRLWLLRTGLRKGISDSTLPEEQAAAPDVAVLRSGFFAPWAGMLAGFQETSVLVEPDSIAGLAGTKPLLIIPSGGLSGLAASAFFRAGLAEYVASGGVVLCFTQQKGADLAALPLPSGSTLDAAGWAEDSGALYRSSRVHTPHPVLSGVTGTVPAVETDGSFHIASTGARVLLVRSDGRSTLLLYPFGRGHVAIAAFASDVNRLQGLLAEDERVIVRNLVLWAKAGGSLPEFAAGKQFNAVLTVRLPDQGDAPAVRFTVLGPDRVRPQFSQTERTFPLSAASRGTTTVPHQYWIPAGTPPGIYRSEYILTDGKKRVLTPAAEAREGWFAVVPKTAPTSWAAPAAGPAIAPPPLAITAVPLIVPAGDTIKLTLELVRIPGTAGKQDLLVRAAGQERPVTLDGDKTTVSFDLPGDASSRPLSYAVHHAAGRTILRGSVLAVPAAKAGVSVDRGWYAAGQTVRIAVTGMGLGAVTLTGPGTELNQHISANKVFDLPLPASLPAGVYPLAWEFLNRAGVRQEGTIPIAVAGASVRCTAAEFRRTAEGGEAVLTLHASGAVAAALSARLVGPDGTAHPAVERSLALKQGPQTLTIPLTFPPPMAGIWQLLYSVTTRLPEGPGYPPKPITMAAGRVLADVGTAAVIGFRLDRPVYYDPQAGAGGAVYVAAAGKTVAEVLVEGRRQRKETIELPGTAVLPFSLDKLGRGRHRVRVTASGAPGAVRELTVLYGANLPDLAVSIKSADPVSPTVEVGMGITNQGRAASSTVAVSLFEGDPARGGALIESFTIPPLEPGRQFVGVIPWSLAGRAGERTLVAVVDREQAVVETNEENNSASMTFQIPELLLSIVPKKESFQAGEPLGYLLRAVNFSSAAFRPLFVDLQVTDTSGRTLAPETVQVPELAPGAQTVQERTLNLATPQEGTYLLRGTARADRVLASDSAGIVIVPTLLLAGSLEGTPEVASPCAPFTIQYRAENAGTVKPAGGTLRIEVLSRKDGQSALSRQIPFAYGRGTAVIDRIDLPRGEYTLVFRGTAENPERGVRRDFLFAEQPLTVSGPFDVQRSTTVFPRVLVWTGGEDSTPIEKALGEKIVKEAFGDGDLHLKVVTSANDFSNHALTGLYNTYVLLEINGLLDTVEVLKHGLSVGHGVVIIGSGDRSRAVAEGLGFRFTGMLPPGSEGITFPAGSGLGVTGAIPLSGNALLPVKKGARSLAAYSGGQPAFLLDASDGGKTIVLPFSLVRSSLHAGISSLYGVVLRAAVLAAAPEREDTDLVPVRLSYRAPAGTAQVRIVETLPTGAEVLWTSAKPAKKDQTMTFELTAGKDPATLLYLFRPAAGGVRSSSSEVFYQCDGSYVSQGTIE